MTVRTRGIVRIGIAAVLLCGLLFFAAPVSARNGAVPQHYSWMVPIADFWVLNQCTDEWLVCQGEARYVLHDVTDSSGGHHWLLRGQHNLRGVGLGGNEYQVISTFSQHSNVGQAGVPYEWTFVNTSPLISRGEDTNMVFYVRNKVTINALGEVTVSYSDVWIECRGKA